MALASSELGDYSESTVTFLQSVLNSVVEEALVKGCKRSEKVIDFKHPAELESLIDLSIKDTGCSNETILQLCRQTVSHSVNTSHPRFWNQFHSGPNPYALAAGYTVDTLNTNQHTFEVAPVLQVAEKHVIKELGKVVGYEEDETDGIFLPGGSICNMVAYHVARYRHYPDVKEKGMFGMKRLVMFVSEESHYSTKKGAMFLGMGIDSVVAVKTDSSHRMLMSDLEKKIKETREKGDEPYLVHATLGTTVAGAFDSSEDVADICKKHNLWFHADICWGAPVLFSPSHKHLAKGIHRADSVAMSFQKLMGVTMQCCPVLIKDKTKKLLQDSNSTRVHYLFQEDKFYDSSYDLGYKTIQCGRKADAYKLWIMWKALGHEGMARRVDRNFQLAEYFLEKLKTREGFLLTVQEVAPQIKRKMMDAGSMMVGYNPMQSKGYVNFFRMVFVNPLTTHSDLDFLLDEMERLGHDL